MAAATQCTGVVCFGKASSARDVLQGTIGSKLCLAPSADGLPCNTCFDVCVSFPFYRCGEPGCGCVITGADKECAALHPAWTIQKQKAQEKKASAAALNDGGLSALRTRLGKYLNAAKAKDFEQSPASAYKTVTELVSLHAHVPVASS